MDTKERIECGEFPDEAAYLLDLVRQDRERRVAVRLRELIEEGLASGPLTPLTEDEVVRIPERIATAV
jgi:Arc/MetJ-type ribon-helix-helix transcriptional regulator